MAKSLSMALCFFIFISSNLYAQDLLDDISEDVTIGSAEGIFSETIDIISRSGKIFILTNSNQLLGKGDFITLILKNDGPVARAVVAKVHEGRAGIKVLKVYSLSRWKKLRKSILVDILKGDDSELFKPKKSKEEAVLENTSIETEEDLFKDGTVIDEDLSDFYKDTRVIKPDNIISAAYNQFRIKEASRPNELTASNFNFAWAYQYADNYWVEGLFGNALFDNFPRDGEQLRVLSFTGRLKYAFKAPLYSFIFPYVGFQTINVITPEGFGDVSANKTQEQADNENATIGEISTTEIIGGVTFLRRLVPGWFFKAEFGTDFNRTFYNLGFAVEF